MKEINVVRQHQLGQQACLELADQITDKLIARIGGSKRIEGSTIYYKHGSGSQGQLVSSDNRLEISVKLGLLVRAFGKSIEQEIESSCDEYLQAHKS